jgi:hypothetical protein
VADLLGGLCTTATPGEIWRPPGADPHDLFAARQVYSRPHVPQGAPTSPALANACAYRMDCRLAALAEAAGARYTRYADDLAFSGDGDFARRARRFSHHVGAILIEEGFQANYRKTRLMRAGARQHLAGLVTNAHLNIPRDDYDRLKAILTNCLRLGPATQNRDNHPAFREHLEGRVGFVETVNAARGRKLRSLLERIDWDPKR